MNQFNPYAQGLGRAQAVDTNAFLTKVYAFMAAGLFATGVTATAVMSSPTLFDAIYGGSHMVFYGLLIAEVGMVLAFRGIAHRLSATAAAALFFIYAIVNGATLAGIFLMYTASSIGSTFFVTAGTFGAVSAFGYATKRDLSGVGTFALMGLVGLIIASVVNIFLASPMIYWLTTFMGVIVFTALTAYHTQKIKALAAANPGAGETNLALQAALVLYLDFINMFLMLLRLFGRRR